MQIVPEALGFATKHHQTMTRKGTKIPYMAHLLNVCKLLAERDCRDEVLAAALLHDIVEDTFITIEEVEGKFGQEIAHMVRGATEPLKLQKPYVRAGEAQTWKERKEHTIAFIAKEATPDQLLVILADKLDNIQSIGADVNRLGNQVWLRFNADKEHQQWYFTSLVEALEKRRTDVPPPFEELLQAFKKYVTAVFND
jgi:(p)ppGpp synthase/HD superfamily hydrolase